jgi:glycosyltransferase involved in cell wall biosynthesis
MAEPRTIAIVYNDDFYLHRFKGGLLKALSEAGHTVYAIAPVGESVEAIEELGATFIDWPLVRRGASPPRELQSLLALRSIYKRIRPDLVHHFTAKPRVYGAFAARLSGVPLVVASVNGLGYVYTGRGLKSSIVRPVSTLLNRLAFGISEAVLFQNHDDIKFFEETRMVSKKTIRHVPGGSGIDTELYSPDSVDAMEIARLRSSLDIPADVPVVVMVGRMLTHKGVHEYVESARKLEGYQSARFLLVGPADPGNPASIPQETLVDWGRSGVVSYLGERSDIRELMAMSDIVVLPSYREGFPRVLIEAAAMGKPMVTTDTPGCREVVVDGENGLLVPVRDADALGLAMRKLLASPALRKTMGEAARKKALSEFDERNVTQNIIAIYDELLTRTGVT